MRFAAAFLRRFWDRVQKTKSCWNWMGCTTSSGYGMVQCRSISQQPLLCHRVAWSITNGPIPGDLHVLHKCDNPSCVNPAHLFLGTQCDNNRDRDRKGRTASGDSNGARTKPERNPFVRNHGSGLKGIAHPMNRWPRGLIDRIRSARRGEVKGVAESAGMSVQYAYNIRAWKVWR